MTVRRAVAALGLAALLCSPAIADDEVDLGRLSSDLARLEAIGLPQSQGVLPLYYSRSAEAEAAIYLETLGRAVTWYRAKTGWDGEATIAVLSADDWARVSLAIPYPSPHASVRHGLVVMPDRIESHPGFDDWDLEGTSLNAALTFHEIGHVIAWRIGLWSDNFWINELVANAFLAAYVRAEAPEHAALLDGVPPHFTEFGPYTALVDFDDIYFTMGPLNYAWFQFRIAELADYLVAGRDFAETVDLLKAAFPYSVAHSRETLSATLARLERIAPGISERATGLLGESALPLIPTVSCGPDAGGTEDRVPLVLENRADAPVSLNRSRINIESQISLEVLLGDLPEDADFAALADEAMADGRYAMTLAPGDRVLRELQPVGEQWTVMGGDCFVVPAEPARFVWTGG